MGRPAWMPPLPPTPCFAAPGSAIKEAMMAFRQANGYALHHPADATHATAEASTTEESARPIVDPVPPSEMIRGIELDKSRPPIVYRARPRWRSARVPLGTFPTYAEAAQAIERFYRERLGLFEPLRDDHHRWYGPAVGTIRTPAGWCDLEPPAGVSLRQAARAARVVRSRSYCDCRAVSRAYRREVDRIAAGT